MPCFFRYVTLFQQYFNILLSSESQTFCFISLLNSNPYKMIVILMQDDLKNPFEYDFVPNANQLRNVQNLSALRHCCQVTECHSPSKSGVSVKFQQIKAFFCLSVTSFIRLIKSLCYCCLYGLFVAFL